MRYCARCGAAIGESDRFCENCGEPCRGAPRPRFNWRLGAIIALSIFLVAGTAYLLCEHFILQASEQAEKHGHGDGDEDDHELKQDPLLGIAVRERLHDSWDYPGGILEEYRGEDEAGNSVVRLLDRGTGELLGLNVNLPPAENISVSRQDAEAAATAAALQAGFFDDPTLQLVRSELDRDIIIRDEPDYGSYYCFEWKAIDESSGAILLRWVTVHIHAENGRITYYAKHDGGEVTIPTKPDLGRTEAVRLALEEANAQMTEPRAIKEVLYVSTAFGGQKLVWEIIVEEAAESAEDHPCTLFFSFDAHTGDLLDTAD